MMHIVIKEREGDVPNVHVYETAEQAVEEIRYAKMMQNHITFKRIRLFEAKELNTDSIQPMTREEIMSGSEDK